MFSHWLDQPEKEVAEEENVVPWSPITSTDGIYFTDVCNKIGDTEQMTPKWVCSCYKRLCCFLAFFLGGQNWQSGRIRRLC